MEANGLPELLQEGAHASRVSETRDKQEAVVLPLSIIYPYANCLLQTVQGCTGEDMGGFIPRRDAVFVLRRIKQYVREAYTLTKSYAYQTIFSTTPHSVGTTPYFETTLGIVFLAVIGVFFFCVR